MRCNQEGNHMNHMNHINIYTYLYDTTNTNPSSLVGGSCSVVHFFGDIKPQRPRSQIGKKRKKYRTWIGMQHYFADVNIIDKSHVFLCPEMGRTPIFLPSFWQGTDKSRFFNKYVNENVAIYICVCVRVFLEDKCIPCQQVAIFSTKPSLLFGKTHCSSQRGSICGKLFFWHKQVLFWVHTVTFKPINVHSRKHNVAIHVPNVQYFLSKVRGEV